VRIVESARAGLRFLSGRRFGARISGLGDRDLGLIVNLAFLAVLGRPAEPATVKFFARRLRTGMSLKDLIATLEESDEAKGVLPASDASRKTAILGTDRLLTQEVWDARAAKVARRTSTFERREATPFEHSGQYDVSAIASIYKAGRFIERFLENIVSQSIFDRAELIIVDADSPDGEEEIIRAYQERFPNIVYRRFNFRIGIYDAWNVGVEMARGRYLTNTNADDLRRSDSFEIQARALDESSSADIVYQNFFYTFDPTLTFEQIAEIGFVSNLPQIQPSNLFLFNSPHNAPMWRRALHADVGLFDASFRSAGDWEFWLRCLSRGKSFHRIDTPHVAYFHNPEGVSTRADTRGVEEGVWVRRRYRNFLALVDTI